MCFSRILALLLCLFACSTVHAANGILPGNGTASSPYLIEDLADFDVFCNTSSYNKVGVYTKLMTDLDLGSRTYTHCVVYTGSTPSNAMKTFYGKFNGDFHTISNMTVINLKQTDLFNIDLGGLFNVIEATGEVRNLTLENVYLDQGSWDVGGLAGRNLGLIDNCHVTGSVRVYRMGMSCYSTGLLVGNNVGSGVINNCSARGRVSQSGTTSKIVMCGGLCGSNDCATITNSYADVDVSGVQYVGSFCGWNGYESSSVKKPGLIMNCYSHGSAVGTSQVGGFIGYNGWPVINCYSNATAELVSGTTSSRIGFVGGMPSGASSSTILNCFWDEDVALAGGSLYNPLPISLLLNQTSGTTVVNSGFVTSPVITANGDPVWTEGKIDGGLSFDGINDYLSIKYYNGNMGNTPRACSVWIKTTATTTQVISTWGAESTGKLWRLMMDADGKYRIAAYGGTKKSSVAINDGQWHHIAVTLPYLNAPTVADTTLYLDGVADTQATVSASQAIDTSSDVSVTIGASVSGTTVSNYFSGTMDDFRIYDIALSASDIARLAGLQEPELANCLDGLTTEQMQDMNTYLNAGWNIIPADQANSSSLWVMAESEYPKFTWSQPRNDAAFFDTQTLKGMTESDAIAALANAGITAMVKYDCSRLVAAGCVIIPETKDFILRDATELTIVVSTGVYDWSTNPGAGTIDNPYQISTPGMLFGMITDQYYYYELANDIDLNYYDLTNGCAVMADFGVGSSFFGSFDGKFHVIRNAKITGLQGLRSGYTGFFAKTNNNASMNTTIKRLGLENINITSNNKYTGCFIGYNDSSCIYDCYVIGSLYSCYNYEYSWRLGGFAGHGDNISRCYADTNITCNVVSGGFSGEGYNIRDCYSKGSISDKFSTSGYPGGFIGVVMENNTVLNCYSNTSVISAYGSTITDGFIGKRSNYYTGTVLNCFWDYQASGVGSAGIVSNGASAKSTAEMQNKATFVNAGWDLASDDGDAADWRMPVAGGYPRLYWEMNPDADASGAVDLADWSVFAQNWLGTGPACVIKSDLDGSGAIDLADLEIFAESWLSGPSNNSGE